MFGFAMIPAILQFLIMMFSQTEPAVFMARCGNIKLAEKRLLTFYTQNLPTGYAFNCEESQREY